MTVVLSLAHTLPRGWMQDGVENPSGLRCPQEQGPTWAGQMAPAFLYPHLRGTHIPGFSAPGLVLPRGQEAVKHSSYLCDCFLLGGPRLLESSSGDLIGREPGLECGQTTFLLASAAYSLALRAHTQRRERAAGGPPEPRSPAGLGSLCSEGPLVLGPSLLHPSRAGSPPYCGTSVPWSQVVWLPKRPGCVRGGGHRWWSFRGCLRSAAAAALHLILVEVDGKCQFVINSQNTSFILWMHWA